MHYEYDGGPRTSSCLHSFLRSTVCEKDIHHSPNNAKQPEVEPEKLPGRKKKFHEKIFWNLIMSFGATVDRVKDWLEID
jgi:hypothetical protein